MATQVFGNMYEYCVIGAASAPTFPTLSDKTHIGYDTPSVNPHNGGDSVQGQNIVSSGNGTIPDFIKNQTSILNNPASATIGYKNPS